MCGISGYVTQTDKSDELSRSLQAIQHRGPDSTGALVWDDEDRNVGLGHVRLSIIDLTDSGNQPMLSRDGKVAMVFNGEIYNLSELKAKLVGHVFLGRSDSEVLLEYYCRFGVKAFRQLRGMFAVAFYELESRRVILLRDQLGIKPMYYVNSGRDLYFSSEIRGLRPFLTKAPVVSRDDLFEFLSSGFVYEPNTGFEGILKLPAGHYATMTDNGLSFHEYFSIDKESKTGEYSEKLISSSIEQQLDADAKLGVFFSGGLDSSTIAAFSKKPCLFAQYAKDDVSLSGAQNDEPYADEIAERLNLDLQKISIEANGSDVASILSSMRQVACGTEELISDYTYFASAELSKAARAKGFKVMLSGMGGDEVFVGYPRYRLLIHENIFRALGAAAQFKWLRSILKRVPSIAKKVDRFASFYKEEKFPLSYSHLLGYFENQELKDLLGEIEYERHANRFVEKCKRMLEGFEQDCSLVRAMVLDYHGFLSHNLTVADKSSMSAGLELRVPLLGQELYCGYLAALRNGNEPLSFGKRSLKKLLLLKLPRRLVERRKTGFNPPLDAKINQLGELEVLHILRSGKIAKVLNELCAEDIVRKHFTKQENNSYKIWQLLYLSFWLDEHIIS